MDNERVHTDIRRNNTCATVGFLLTLLNIVISIVLLITENTFTLIIFTSIMAFASLALCIVGVSNANRVGKGKAISIIGIILNVLIILAVAGFLIFLLLFMQACTGIFQGLIPK